MFIFSSYDSSDCSYDSSDCSYDSSDVEKGFIGNSTLELTYYEEHKDYKDYK